MQGGVCVLTRWGGHSDRWPGQAPWSPLVARPCTHQSWSAWFMAFKTSFWLEKLPILHLDMWLGIYNGFVCNCGCFSFADASVLPGATTVIFPLQIAFIPTTIVSLDASAVRLMSYRPVIGYCKCQSETTRFYWLNPMDARDQRWLMRVQATSGFSDFEYFCVSHHIMKINKCI